MKIKVIFDSTVGLTQEEIISKGAGFVPITVSFNGEDRLAGVNIDTEFLWKNMNKETTVKTAAVSLGLIETSFREALKESDHAVYISLSSGLSASNKNAMMVANDPEFAGKVTVLESNMISPILIRYVDRIIEKASEGSLDELMRLLEYLNKDVFAYLVPENMLFLHKGGRISKIQYIAGSLLKVQPILSYADGGLQNRDVIKGKKLSGALTKLESALTKELINYEGIEIEFGIVAFGKQAEAWIRDITESLDRIAPGVETFITTLDAAVMAHTGPAYGLSITKK